MSNHGSQLLSATVKHELCLFYYDYTPEKEIQVYAWIPMYLILYFRSCYFKYSEKTNLGNRSWIYFIQLTKLHSSIEC